MSQRAGFEKTRFPRYNNPRTLLFESRTGQQKGAERSHTFERLSLYLSSESLQVCPHSEVSPELCTSWDPSVIISLQGLSKGGCGFRETYVIAQHTS